LDYFRGSELQVIMLSLLLLTNTFISTATATAEAIICVGFSSLALTRLQNYFTKLLEDRTKCVIKPQYVDHIPKALPPPPATSPRRCPNYLLVAIILTLIVFF
jgi:translation initiation factor RLI1